MKLDHPMSARRVAAITEVLRGQALTVRDLAAKVFLCHEQVRRYVVELHAAGAVRIVRWSVQKEGRETRIPVFRLGAGPDAPRPQRLTGAQRQAAQMARIRANTERYDLHKARNRARKMKVARDPLVGALFGAVGVREVRP